MKDLISMRSLTKSEINHLVETAEKIENKQINPDFSGIVAALLFFEPSTRTAFSFDAALKRMNAKSIVMSGTDSTSVKKGESFADTILTVSQYADLLVIRSKVEGSSKYASELIEQPVINAGDGSNQHPTQALLDIYSIKKTQGKIDNLNIALLGDLRFGRTVHSLAYGLSEYSTKFHFISPNHLTMPNSVKNDLIARDVDFKEITEVESLSDLLESLDIIYVTRIQKERFADPEEFEKAKDSYQITKRLIDESKVKENFRIMHPLPRVNEITTDVDDTPYAYYFQQAKNGVYMRQSIIYTLLGGDR